MVNDLIDICNILGCEYDVDYLNSLSDCQRVNYLLSQIYRYLGGQ